MSWTLLLFLTYLVVLFVMCEDGCSTSGCSCMFEYVKLDVHMYNDVVRHDGEWLCRIMMFELIYDEV